MTTPVQTPDVTRDSRVRTNLDLLGPAVLSGFVATAVMAFVAMIGYFAAEGIGHLAPGMVTTWFRNLTNNPVTDTVRGSLIGVVGLNLAIGLVWAMVFAYDANRRLGHYPGWLRGLLFIIPPYLLSLALLPLVPGAGFAGIGLQAGPLPILGNLILHSVYGIVLGAVYVLDDRSDSVRNGDLAIRVALKAAEIKAGLDVLIGGVVGMIVAIIGTALVVGISEGAIVGAAVGGGVIGAALGAIVGSISGLTDTDPSPARPVVPIAAVD